MRTRVKSHGDRAADRPCHEGLFKALFGSEDWKAQDFMG